MKKNWNKMSTIILPTLDGKLPFISIHKLNTASARASPENTEASERRRSFHSHPAKVLSESFDVVKSRNGAPKIELSFPKIAVCSSAPRNEFHFNFSADDATDFLARMRDESWDGKRPWEDGERRAGRRFQGPFSDVPSLLLHWKTTAFLMSNQTLSLPSLEATPKIVRAAFLRKYLPISCPAKDFDNDKQARNFRQLIVMWLWRNCALDTRL